MRALLVLKKFNLNPRLRVWDVYKLLLTTARCRRHGLLRPRARETGLIGQVSLLAVSMEYLFALFLILFSVGTCAEHKNVLFLVVDDLRPDAGAYGHDQVLTPNINKLAEQSLVFERAYCQFAFCAPSRNSFMTGRRPDTTKAWNFIDHFREKGIGQNWTSMPQYFKKHGYFTSGVGKLYHPNLPPNYDPPSWTDLDIFPYVNDPPKSCPNNTSWCALDRNNFNFSDINSTEEILKRLNYAARNRTRPFFLGIGFHKPHLPFRFPEEFLHLYPTNVNQIDLASHLLPPQGMPPIAWNKCLGPGRYKDLDYPLSIYQPLPTEVQKTLRRAYYSAISFTDSLIGQVLHELENLGLANDTIVSFNADHGWQLGEHNEWCKMTNFELGTRVPMMIRVPWKPESMGKRTFALSELVDLYPTLAELAGLPPSAENLEGKSLVPLFTNQSGQIKNMSLSQFTKCGTNMSQMETCLHTSRQKFDYMGYTMRTDRYRYTEWVAWDGDKLQPIWDKRVGVELYDHQGDMGDDFNTFENVNIADKETELVEMLREQLHAAFKN